MHLIIEVALGAIAVAEAVLIFWYRKGYKRMDEANSKLVELVHDNREDCDKLAESLSEEIVLRQNTMPVIRKLYDFLWGQTYNTEEELKRMGLDDNPIIREVVKEHDSSDSK